jgi:hypothetical protein
MKSFVSSTMLIVQYLQEDPTMMKKVTNLSSQLFVQDVVQSQHSPDSRFFMQFMAMYLELTKSRIKVFFVQNVKSKLDLKLQQ